MFACMISARLSRGRHTSPSVHVQLHQKHLYLLIKQGAFLFIFCHFTVRNYFLLYPFEVVLKFLSVHAYYYFWLGLKTMLSRGLLRILFFPSTREQRVSPLRGPRGLLHIFFFSFNWAARKKNAQKN
jgi:hypothetical protein